MECLCRASVLTGCVGVGIELAAQSSAMPLETEVKRNFCV